LVAAVRFPHAGSVGTVELRVGELSAELGLLALQLFDARRQLLEFLLLSLA
jgi:hypothetical protein